MGRREQKEKAEAWVEGQLGALPETDLRSTGEMQLIDERDRLRGREKRAKKMVQKAREAQVRSSSTPVGLRRKREALESAIKATEERRRDVSTEMRRRRTGAEDRVREALRRAERARGGLSRNERGEIKSLDEARRLFRGLSSAEQESFRARLDEDLVPILEEAADPERPSFEEVMEESAEEEISGHGGSSEPGQSDLGRESQGSQEEKGKDEDDSPDRGSPDRDRGRGRGRGGIGR
jgi:hypothetical protein